MSGKITFLAREDEMLAFHKDGKYWLTLYAPGPHDAAELEKWLHSIQPKPAKINGNTKALAETIRAMADEIAKHDVHPDHAELLRVLARVIEGKPLAKSFGAPGDWGYGTPIGDALAGGAL